MWFCCCSSNTSPGDTFQCLGDRLDTDILLWDGADATVNYHSNSSCSSSPFLSMLPWVTCSSQVPAPPAPRLHLDALTEKGKALCPVFRPEVNKMKKPRKRERAPAVKSRRVCERCPGTKRGCAPGSAHAPGTDLPKAASLCQAAFNSLYKTPKPTQRAHPLSQPSYIPAHGCQDEHRKVGTERERKKERESEKVTHRWRRHRGFQSHFELRMTEGQTLPQSPSPRPPGPRRRPATAPGPHWPAARGEGRGTASGGWRRRTNRAGGDLRATDTHTEKGGGKNTERNKMNKKPRQNTDRETIKVEPGHEGRPPPHSVACPSGAALPEGRPTARI